jgi:hypothetical protein
MKKLISLVMFAIPAMATQASAVYNPEWERPIETAPMAITQSRMGFQSVQAAQVTLTRKDGATQEGPTGMILEYTQDASQDQAKVIRDLVITQRIVDECGSIHYTATLPQIYLGVGEGRQGHARFIVSLADHSHRTCADSPANGWEASVRQGFGWCGTMDSTMSLVGTPEPVFTISSN